MNFDDLQKHPMIIGIAVLAVVVILYFMFKTKSNSNNNQQNDKRVKETFIETLLTPNDNNSFQLKTINERDKEIIENFPSAEMNVMYSDANGNLATTQDLGLKNLTVSSDAQFNSNINVNGNINAGNSITVKGNVLGRSVFSENGSQVTTDGVLAGNTYGGRLHLLGNDVYVMAKNGMRIATDPNTSNPHGGSNGNLIVDKGIYTPSLSRTSGDWLHVNDDVNSVGKTALYGNLSINDTRQGNGGLTVGEWSNAGQGNIKATGTITSDGDTNVGGNLTLRGSNSWVFHTPDDKRKIMYVAPRKDDNSDWKWNGGFRVNNNGNMVVNGNQLSIGADIEAGSLENWMGLHLQAPGHAHIRLRPNNNAAQDDYIINRDGVLIFNTGDDNMTLDRGANLKVLGEVRTNSNVTLGPNRKFLLAPGSDNWLRLVDANGNHADHGFASANMWAQNFHGNPVFVGDEITVNKNIKAGSITTGNINTTGKIYSKANIGAGSDGFEFRHSNESQGIGLGYNTIYATGSNANQDLYIKSRGTGKIYINDRDILAELDELRRFKLNPLKCVSGATYQNNNEDVGNATGWDVNRSLGHLFTNGLNEGRNKSAINQACAASY